MDTHSIVQKMPLVFFVASGDGSPKRDAPLSQLGEKQMRVLKDKKRALVERVLYRGDPIESTVILTATGNRIVKFTQSAEIIKENEKVVSLVTLCFFCRNDVCAPLWILQRIFALNPKSDVVVVVGYGDILAVLAEQYRLYLQQQFSSTGAVLSQLNTPAHGEAIAVYGGTNAQGNITSAHSIWLEI